MAEQISDNEEELIWWEHRITGYPPIQRVIVPYRAQQPPQQSLDYQRASYESHLERERNKEIKAQGINFMGEQTNAFIGNLFIQSMPIVLGDAPCVVTTELRRATGARPHITKKEREQTPPALARWLVELARRVRVTTTSAA